MALTNLERGLCDAIARRKDNFLDQLRAHVAIPTGGGHAPGLDEYRRLLAARLEALGAAIEEVPGDPRPPWLDPPGSPAASAAPPVLVARGRSSGGQGPRVLIAGHLDTVHDPQGDFRVLELSGDGRLATGPGAVDMKGGIVIALTALEELSEAGVEVAWTVLLNSDEETGSFHSRGALEAEARRHDLGIAVEPALPGGALAISRGGSGQFMIETRGRAAHAGRDFARGVSAVVELARVIQALHALARPQDGVVVNVGPLQGGKATNVVPDRAACWGNVRYRDARQAQLLGEAIDALATAADAMPGVTVHRLWNRPAKPAEAPVEALAEAAIAAAADLGSQLPLGSTGGACDGNILQNVGLPTIDTLGVCGGNLHRTDEFVEVESLVARCRLLAVLLARVGGRNRSIEIG